MYTRQTKIINKTGLHARPASEFVLLAKSFTSDISVKNISMDKESVNAKSIVRLLAEGINQGTEVEISAKGIDETEAVRELVSLIESGFGE